MKIRDIILENEPFDWRWETAEELFKTDPNGKPRWGVYREPEYHGLDVDKIASDAKGLQGRYPGAFRKAIKVAIQANLDQRKSTKQRPSTSSTPQDQRDRQDTMGRNLRHDRYYRDKDDKKEKPGPLDHTDNVFGDPNDIDKIPGVKRIKKVAKDASVKTKSGSRVAKAAQNFDNMGKRVKKIGSRR